MNRRTQTMAHFIKKPFSQPQQSLEVSVTSSNSNDYDHPSFKKPNHSHNQTTFFSSILKNNLTNTSDTMPRMKKLTKAPEVRFSENQSGEVLEITLLEMRETIHELKKKDASQRLEISRLNKQLQMLAEQYSELQAKLKQKEVKINKNNEYTLKLDRELRLYRDEVSQSDKMKGMCTKMARIEQENKEMRYVIQEQLREIEELQGEIGRMVSTCQDQETQEVEKHLKTYSSNSDSGRHHNPNSNYNFHPLEITMNPNQFSNNESEGYQWKGHYLSTINQDEGTDMDLDGYGRGKGQEREVNLLHGFSDYCRSKMEEGD